MTTVQLLGRDDAPADILAHALMWLSPFEMVRLSRVSRDWRDAIVGIAMPLVGELNLLQVNYHADYYIIAQSNRKVYYDPEDVQVYEWEDTDAGTRRLVRRRKARKGSAFLRAATAAFPNVRTARVPMDSGHASTVVAVMGAFAATLETLVVQMCNDQSLGELVRGLIDGLHAMRGRCATPKLKRLIVLNWQPKKTEVVCDDVIALAKMQRDIRDFANVAIELPLGRHHGARLDIIEWHQVIAWCNDALARMGEPAGAVPLGGVTGSLVAMRARLAQPDIAFRYAHEMLAKHRVAAFRTTIGGHISRDETENPAEHSAVVEMHPGLYALVRDHAPRANFVDGMFRSFVRIHVPTQYRGLLGDLGELTLQNAADRLPPVLADAAICGNKEARRFLADVSGFVLADDVRDDSAATRTSSRS